MLKEKIQKKIDLKTKPIGSLGKLEKIALQIACIQKRLTPSLINPTITIFSGDHGITKEKISAYPQDVTHQMIYNFINEGAAINVFSKQHNIKIKIIDSGVNFNFRGNKKIIHEKVNYGTKSFLNNKAMSSKEFRESVKRGEKTISKIVESGTNIIGFGEMGIGNTSSSSIIMSYICNIPVKKCVGRGTGLNNEQLLYKINILEKSKKYHGKISDTNEILRSFGGFEMVQMYGAMLEAYRNNMILLVDGFISSVVMLAASRINPNILENTIFCHLSDENAHSLLLKYLNVEPILKLNLRLGEGTGCALAFPLLESAVSFLNNMASFEDSGVSNKIDNERRN